MILELFFWWLGYGVIFLSTFGVPLSIASDFDSKILGAIIFVLFSIPVNGIFFSAFYTNFYLKWFL